MKFEMCLPMACDLANLLLDVIPQKGMHTLYQETYTRMIIVLFTVSKTGNTPKQIKSKRWIIIFIQWIVVYEKSEFLKFFFVYGVPGWLS